MDFKELVLYPDAAINPDAGVFCDELMVVNQICISHEWVTTWGFSDFAYPSFP